MKRFLFIIAMLLLHSVILAQQKLRVLVLTDIENEPDDAESMVRFLTYSNMWDVEGLIATTSVHQQNKVADGRIKAIVTAYGKVRDNLLLHEPGYPSEAYLQSIIKRGYVGFGMNAVGKGKDSEGSDWIISVVDRDDARPVWIPIWGGANCLAQALWKVKSTRSAAAVEKFVSRLRIYSISDQDDSGPWLRKTFPGLFYIVSPGVHSRNGYYHATWSGISGDVRHRFGGPDSGLVGNKWLLENVRTNHGPLGEQYPNGNSSWKAIRRVSFTLSTTGWGIPNIRIMVAGVGDMNCIHHPIASGFQNRKQDLSGRMRKMRCRELMEIFTTATKQLSGAGAEHIKMTLLQEWIGV